MHAHRRRGVVDLRAQAPMSSRTRWGLLWLATIALAFAVGVARRPARGAVVSAPAVETRVIRERVGVATPAAPSGDEVRRIVREELARQHAAGMAPDAPARDDAEPAADEEPLRRARDVVARAIASGRW